MKSYFIGFSVVLILLSGCSRSKAGIRHCDTQPKLDCEVVFKQFARTLSIEFGITGLTVLGAEFGAKNQIEVDSITSDLLVHIHQLCTDFNFCMLTREEYKAEMSFLLRAQLKIRGYDDSAQSPALKDELKTLFTEISRKAQVRAVQRMLNLLGYGVDVDGAAGRQTKDAIASFASDHDSEIQQIGKAIIDEELYLILWISAMKRNHITSTQAVIASEND